MEEQAKKEEAVMTEEEESVAEALELEERDMLSMDMGRKRPTDMVNNRHDMMPAAGTVLVEAELNTRMGM